MVPRKLVVLGTVLILAGCYHQVVRTGAPPSNVVIERPWTATFVFGLVPATVINVASTCPNGLAVVETKQTFMNGLVGVLTLGIYTPQSVRITCAAGTQAMIDARTIRVPAGASPHARLAAVNEAIVLAQETGGRVAVVFGSESSHEFELRPRE